MNTHRFGQRNILTALCPVPQAEMRELNREYHKGGCCILGDYNALIHSKSTVEIEQAGPSAAQKASSRTLDLFQTPQTLKNNLAPKKANHAPRNQRAWFAFFEGHFLWFLAWSRPRESQRYIWMGTLFSLLPPPVTTFIFQGQGGWGPSTKVWKRAKCLPNSHGLPHYKESNFPTHQTYL